MTKVASIVAHNAKTPSPARTSGGLAERCADLFETAKLPGLAVSLIAADEKPEFVFLGHADVDRGWPVDSETVFRIGSVGKTMTAIAVMQLVESGQVDLDLPVNGYLRHFEITEPAGPDLWYRLRRDGRSAARCTPPAPRRFR